MTHLTPVWARAAEARDTTARVPIEYPHQPTSPRPVGLCREVGTPSARTPARGRESTANRSPAPRMHSTDPAFTRSGERIRVWPTALRSAQLMGPVSVRNWH